MKFSHVAYIAALAAGLASGCTRHPKNITPLPFSGRVGGGNTELNPNTRPLDPDGPNRNLAGRGPTLPFDPNAKGTDLTQTPIPPTSPDSVVPLNPTGGFPQTLRDDIDKFVPDPDALRAEIVYFEFDKSVVKRGESAKIARIVDRMKANPTYKLKLEGHADERGTEDYNRALGERRALSVREMLLNLGIPQGSVVTGTYGEDRPAELGHNEAAWSKNRRVEPVLLLPPGTAR